MTPRPSRSRAPLPLAVLVVLSVGTSILGGCGEVGPGASPVSSTSPEGPATPAPSSYPPTEGADMEPRLQRVVEAATADLVSRPGTGTEPVRVVLARRETFPDGAVGCPEPGMMYTQALVEGYRVVLARGDRAWLYTAAEGHPPRLCATDEDDGGSALADADG